LKDTEVVPGVIAAPETIHTPLRGWVYATLQRLRGQPVAQMVEQLRAWERLPTDEFERLHAQRLAAMLTHARATVPLYQAEPWRSALSGPAAGLDAWPVLEKGTLRGRHAELVSQPRASRLLTRKTSGTTGKQAKILFTREADTWAWAHRYRGLAWHGVPIGTRSLRLLKQPRRFRDWLLDQRNLPSLASDAAAEQAIAFVRAARTPMIDGTPSALFYLARQLRRRGLRQPLAPFARCGGEQLFAFQRKEIEQFVGRAVIDSYGCTETGALAGECPAGSMHVYADHVHLEVFQGDRPVPVGGFGDLVVTVLNNPAMPLVRYRVGDRGRLSPEKCRCGLPQPTLLDLEARSADVFAGPDGANHHGSKLVRRLGRLYDEPAADDVLQVQFAQVDPQHWQVLVEAPALVETGECGDGVRPVIEDRLGGIVREVFGSAVQVETRYVSSLPRHAGKFRYYRFGTPAD